MFVLKDLAPILASECGDISWAYVYVRDPSFAEGYLCLADGCSVEYAVKQYGDRVVERIKGYQDMLCIRLKKENE